jgi:hypothetical protein
LWNEAEARTLGFTVGRPIAYLSNIRTLFQGKASGTPLREVILHNQGIGSAARSVARALANFNQSHIATSRRHSHEDEITEVRWVGGLLQYACPHLKGRIDSAVGTLATGLEEEVPLGSTHRDLTPDHILVDQRLALLDLDFLAWADPVLDPATLAAQLSGMSLHSPHLTQRIRAAVRTFTDEYFGRVPQSWRRRLPLHFAGASLKVAVGNFRRQEQNWQEKVAAMVKVAEDSLAGRVW